MAKKTKSIYVLCVVPGCDEEVVNNLIRKSKIDKEKYPIRPFLIKDPRVVLPHEAKRRKKKEDGTSVWETYTTKLTTKKFITYPGYIFIEMVGNEEVFADIRRVRNVVGFLPLPVPGQKPEDMKPPLALADEESARAIVGGRESATEVLFKENTHVSILNGLFAGKDGVIVKIKGKDLLEVKTQFMGADINLVLTTSDVNPLTQEEV